MLSDPDITNLKSSEGSGASASGKNDLMRIHSQKYDDIMKAKKDELRKKRGALEMNSDLDMVDGDGASGVGKHWVGGGTRKALEGG